MNYFLNYVIYWPVGALIVGLLLAYLFMVRLRGAEREQIFWKCVDYLWFSATTVTFIFTLANGYKLMLHHEIDYHNRMIISSVEAIKDKISKAYDDICVEPMMQHIGNLKYTQQSDSDIRACKEVRYIYPVVFRQALVESENNAYQFEPLTIFIKKNINNSYLQRLQKGLHSSLFSFQNEISRINDLKSDVKFMESSIWTTIFVCSLWFTAFVLGFRLMKVHAEVVIAKGF